MDYFLEHSIDVYFEYINTWIQTFCYAITAALALRETKEPGLTRCRMLCGAFMCYVLGNLYWILYFTIYWKHALFFSAADLSWLASYSFLISIDVLLMNDLTDQQRTAVKKHRTAAIVISGSVIIPTHAWMVYTGVSLFNNLCYGIAIFLAGYYSIMLLSACKKENVTSEMASYHVNILIFFSLIIGMFVFSCLVGNIYFLSTAFDVALTVMPFSILAAARKGSFA
jgi:hypothetical protein